MALSAQATDKSVNKATGPLFKTIDTPEKMLALGEAKLADAIKTIGLYRGKAKNVIAAATILIEKHGGQVPKDRAALQQLPGVGRKTANVVLNVAFGEPTIAVDTDIFRVSYRTGLAPGKDVLAVELSLVNRVPEKYLSLRPSLADFAWALYLRGAQAFVPHLRGAEFVQLPGQDQGSGTGEAPLKTPAKKIESSVLKSPTASGLAGRDTGNGGALGSACFLVHF